MTMTELLNHRILDLEDFHLTVYSVAVVILALLAARGALYLIRKALLCKVDGSQWDRAQRMTLFMLVKYLAWILVILFCLQALGIQITLLLAGSAALLVGLGLGIQQIFNDIVSGIFLLFEGTVKIDDILEVDGLVCKVQQIHLRTSKVETRDDITLIIPNHKFINDNVINWSRQPTRHARFHAGVGVAHKSDPQQVHAILLDCMNRQPDIEREAPHQPLVRFSNFGES